MPAFAFSAVDKVGTAQRGVIEAPHAAAARQTLRARGLVPVSVSQRDTLGGGPVPADAAGTDGAEAGGGYLGGGRAGGKRGVATRSGAEPGLAGRMRSRPGRGRGLSPATLALLTRQLATLLAAGLRVEEALATAATGQTPRVAAVVLTLRARVIEGQSLADALDAYPQHFGAYVRAAIRAGEKAGRVDAVMAQLAQHLAARAQTAQAVQLALIYPALLALVSLSIVILLMTWVVPDIARVFAARGANLPLLTRGLMGLADGLRLWGGQALLALLLFGFGMTRWVGAPANRLRWDRFWLSLRPTRGIVSQLNSTRFLTTLAALLQAQVNLVEALQAAAAATPNLAVRERVRAAADKVRQGNSLHRAMSEAQVFPAMALAMMASGEASGRLAQAVDHAAAELTRVLEARIKTAVALFEPGVLLVMGGLVTLIVLAILLPIVSLNSLAGR